MKYMIASDIHGSAFYCRKMLEAFEEERADRLVLLGDLLYHGPRNDLPREYAPKEVIPLLNGVKEARKERGWSQGELAQMVGVSRNTISSIETGAFNPTAKLAAILCIALDKKFEELFWFAE